MVLGGRHTDKKGPRVVVSIGAALLTAGFFLASFAESLGVLYLSYGVLCGFGIGYANIAPMAAAMRWFPDRRGLVSGILVMGFGLAAFVLGAAASQIIASMGWPTAFRVLGGLSLVLCLLGAQFMKFPPPAGRPPGQAAAAAGAAAAGGLPVAPDDRHRHLVVVVDHPSGGAHGGLWSSAHRALRPGGGIRRESAVFAMGVFAVCNGLGRLVVGALWDRLGRNLTMALNAAVDAGRAVVPGVLVKQGG